MKSILTRILSVGRRTSCDKQEDEHQIAFLNSVFLLAGIVSFGMGFVRWQTSVTMGMIDFGFASLSAALLIYLNRHRDKAEQVSLIALVLSFCLFFAIYVLASYNTMRLSLFFLLLAAAFFLKGRKIGRIWLLVTLFAILSVHFLPYFDTGYSNIDIFTTCLYLIALLVIFENYEVFKESQHSIEKEQKALHLTASVFSNTLDGIVIADSKGDIIEVNEAFTQISGYSRDELIGKNPRMLQSGRQNADFYKAMWQSIVECGHWRGEVWNRRKDGELLAEILTISAITDDAGKVTNYVGISSDITLRKKHEKQLEHVAHYDALTGIPNRVLLADRLRQALAHSKREGSILAVCYLDLDGFKLVNDTMGHEAGDEVLIEVTNRIKDTIRGDDTVARLGGDEFAVLMMGLRAPEECSVSLNRLLDAISKPININDKLFEVSASIGVSLYPDDNHDADSLLRHADQAMYIAKQSGKNRYHLYDAENDQRVRSRHEFLARLTGALGSNEFELYYQPKVDMCTLRLIGVEALVRWHHPERGLLSPGEFLHVIEGSVLEVEFGDWVISTALAQLEVWHQAGLTMELSINISARHLQANDFVWKLKRKLLRHSKLPPGSLQIEVLETAALEDIPRVSETIERCHKLGVTFALDDFGTGYSSLSYLGRLPVDTLKIDQSFIRDMLRDKGDRAIVQGVIALAKAFERKTVAEGVETEELFRELLAMGCESGQGYGIGHPMPANSLPEWLEKWNNTPFR